MNQPRGEPGRASVSHHSIARERELEIELARAHAELEAARGGDAMAATSQFLALASSTIDMAMADARRAALAAEAAQTEADTARAAARQVTHDARRELETARAEARAITDDAHAEADEVKARAEANAASLVADERAHLREKLHVLTDVRTALEGERGSLEDSHEELRRRVQDLAESMIALMTTEAPIDGVSALEEIDELPEPGEAETSPAVEEHVDLEPEVADLIAGAAGAEMDREPDPLGSLFTTHGAPLIEQRSAQALQHILDDDSDADERFKSFLEGDDADDPSREWLLRPESS